MCHVIEQHGLMEELNDHLDYVTGDTNFWLGIDKDMDETSDQDDPEAIATALVCQLQQENAEKRSFVEAAKGALKLGNMARELDRARMQLEDMNGIR